MITKIDTPISLGLAVRTARKRLGLTQPQLALASGVGVRFIVELEAGKPTLRLENVLRVLHALGGSLCVVGLVKGQEDLDYDSSTECLAVRNTHRNIESD